MNAWRPGDRLASRLSPHFPSPARAVVALIQHLGVADQDQRQYFAGAGAIGLFVNLEVLGLSAVEPGIGSDPARHRVVGLIPVEHTESETVGVKHLLRKPLLRHAGCSGKPFATVRT